MCLHAMPDLALEVSADQLVDLRFALFGRCRELVVILSAVHAADHCLDLVLVLGVDRGDGQDKCESDDRTQALHGSIPLTFFEASTWPPTSIFDQDVSLAEGSHGLRR